MYKLFASLFITIVVSHFSYSQLDTIRLRNPSFEETPRRGNENVPIKDWFDCGRIIFPQESPPDIHPNGFWENNLPASDKKTYLGMVVRDNGTYESVSQRLDSVILGGKCYKFQLHLAKAEKYVSPTRSNGKDANYTTPVVLRIWGGTGFCNEKELLGESDPVNNTSWQINTFEFNPKNNIRYLTFEAYYKTPILMPYNGNILVDGASGIVRIACPGETLYVSADTKQKLPPHKRMKPSTPSSKTSAQDISTSTSVKPNGSFKPKVLQELNRSNIKEGQTIEIKNLLFKADTSSIDKTSYEVLNDIFGFLQSNPDVIIEIGGHTNSVPTDDYCNRLSTARAKEVAEYLINKGIPPSKVQFKGYGKKSPIADNKTKSGRIKNQRVEIKILSLNQK